MRLKLKKDLNGICFCPSGYVYEYHGEIVINLNSKWAYQSFKQIRNKLEINTNCGRVVFVFTSEVRKLQFVSQEKNQIIFKVV